MIWLADLPGPGVADCPTEWLEHTHGRWLRDKLQAFIASPAQSSGAAITKVGMADQRQD